MALVNGDNVDTFEKQEYAAEPSGSNKGDFEIQHHRARKGFSMICMIWHEI